MELLVYFLGLLFAAGITALYFLWAISKAQSKELLEKMVKEANRAESAAKGTKDVSAEIEDIKKRLSGIEMARTMKR